MKSLTTPYAGFNGAYIRRPLQIFLQLLLPCEHKQFRHCPFDWTHFPQPSTVSNFKVRQSWIRWSTLLQSNIVRCCLPSVTLALSSWQRCQRTVRPSQHRDQQCYQYQRAEFLQWNESDKIPESSKLDELFLDLGIRIEWLLGIRTEIPSRTRITFGNLKTKNLPEIMKESLLGLKWNLSWVLEWSPFEDSNGISSEGFGQNPFQWIRTEFLPGV